MGAIKLPKTTPAPALPPPQGGTAGSMYGYRRRLAIASSYEDNKIKKLEEEIASLKEEQKKVAATPAPTSTATGATATTTTKPNQKLAISSQPAPSVLRTMNK